VQITWVYIESDREGGCVQVFISDVCMYIYIYFHVGYQHSTGGKSAGSDVILILVLILISSGEIVEDGVEFAKGGGRDVCTEAERIDEAVAELDDLGEGQPGDSG